MSEKKESIYSKQRWRNIGVPKYLLMKIDKLVSEGKYISAPDFIRAAIRHVLTEFHPETMKDITKKNDNGKDVISLESLEED